MSFISRLKESVTGDSGAHYVFLGNFEVERIWGADEAKLPGSGLSFSGATVNRMEELGLLLAERGDTVVLKGAVDRDYLAYLRELGGAGADVLVVDENVPERNVSEDALESPVLLERLAAMDDGRTFLAPLGISEVEERLSEKTGLPLAGPSADVCRRVNGKTFSRELTDGTGVRTIPGSVCRTLQELSAALHTHLAAGTRVVVKESLGVSGRGMTVVDSIHKGERLVRMMARRRAAGPLSLTVEQWVDKDYDLNYQFVVDRSGQVRFEEVKKALTENGVHRGHQFPPPLPPGLVTELHETSEVVGRALHAEGYTGLVGVDALVARDGTLYPCLEINARLNMATYQNGIAERFVRAGQYALAGAVELRVSRAHRFAEVREALGELLLTAGSGTGVLVNNFATLNAAVTPGRESHGRVYAVAIADSAEESRHLLSSAERRLTEMTCGA
ncbi:ATP-grasp domain-containing protein [Streptomyces sp. NPDC056528]|uniref:preATP grasp domain-containing protein n=1 Tax=Streptomyces sp. NPDC056528 TaxID=3345854 RepID=UPI0036C5ACEB